MPRRACNLASSLAVNRHSRAPRDVVSTPHAATWPPAAAHQSACPRAQHLCHERSTSCSASFHLRTLIVRHASSLKAWLTSCATSLRSQFLRCQVTPRRHQHNDGVPQRQRHSNCRAYKRSTVTPVRRDLLGRSRLAGKTELFYMLSFSRASLHKLQGTVAAGSIAGWA